MGTPVNPNLLEIVKVNELPDLALALENYFSHCGPDGILHKIDIQGLVDYITPFIASLGASGFVPVSGTVLPNPVPGVIQYSFVGLGTYTWSGGSLDTVQPFNVVSSNGTTWAVANAISLDLTNYATIPFVNALNVPSTELFGAPTPTAVGSSSAPIYTYFFNVPRKNEKLTSCKVQANGSGTIKIKRFTPASDGLTLTYVGQITAAVVAGLNTLNSLSLSFAEGDILAVYSTTAIKRITTINAFSPYSYKNEDVLADVLISTLTEGAVTAQLQINFTFTEIQWYPELKEASDLFNTLLTDYSFGVNPVSGVNSSSSRTYIFDEEIPAISILNTFEFYSTVTGTIRLKRIVKTGNSYAFAEQVTVPVAIGLNTYHLSSLMKFSGDDRIGLYTSTTGILQHVVVTGAYNSFVSLSGDLTTETTAVSPSVNQQLQVRFSFTTFPTGATGSGSDEELSGNNMLISDFKDNAKPDELEYAGTAWTYGSSLATQGAIGAANAIQGKIYTNLNKTVTRVDFILNNSSARVAVFNRPVTYDRSGSIADVDIVTNKLSAYFRWDGTNALPGIQVDKVISFTLVTGRMYRLEIIKSYKDVVFKITDMVNGQTDQLDYIDAAAGIGNVGYAYGKPGAFTIAGSVSLSRIDYRGTGSEVPVCGFYGDSITEGNGVLITDSYVYKAIALIPDLAGYTSAQSGCKAIDVLERLTVELNVFRPKYMHVLIGTNDTDQTTWSSTIDSIAALLIANGVEPIFGCIPANGQDSTQFTTWNTQLIAKGYKVVRYELATTINNAGLAIDTSLFLVDERHPNAAGSTAMYNRMRMDVPEIFNL